MKASPSMIAERDAAVSAACETERADLVTSQSLRCALELSAWLDCRRAASIALGIAEALADKHRGGARPLDLQPEHLFVGDDGRVLIDSNDRRADIEPRRAAQYLSPEEVRGEAGDARSDLYALGVVLYEMLTDRVPFDGKDAETIKHKHLHRMPEPPQVFRGDVPDGLSGLVMRLLEKDPEKRPRRAVDLFGKLREVVEAGAVADNNPISPISPIGPIGSIGPTGNNTAAADIFALDDFGPAAFEGLLAEDAIFDIEFNDGAGDERPAAYEATPTAPRAEPSAALPAITKAPRARLDLATATAIAPRAMTAPAPAAPLEAGTHVLADRTPVAEPGEARLRWLALLLIGLIVAAAFVLYGISKRASIKPDETDVKTAPERRVAAASANTQSGVTVPSPLVGADPPRSAPPAAARASRKQAVGHTSAAPAGRQARPKRLNLAATRRLTRGRKAEPPRRAKRGWLRRMLFFQSGLNTDSRLAALTLDDERGWGEPAEAELARPA